MKKKISLVLLAITVMLLPGCQTAREIDLDEAIANSSADGKYVADSRWEETLEEGKLTVKIEADIMLPGAEKLPVVQVKDSAWKQAEADEVFAYLGEGEKLYARPRPEEKSKQQVQAEIDQMEQDIKDVRAGKIELEDVSLYVVEDITELEDQLEMLYVELETAPETVEKQEAWLNLAEDPEGTMTAQNENWVEAYVDKGGNTYAITMLNGLTHAFMHTSLSYGREDVYYDTIMPEGTEAGETPLGVKMDKEQAIEKAKEIAKGIGAEGMVPVLAQRSFSDGGDGAAPKEAWRVSFGRDYYGATAFADGIFMTMLPVDEANYADYGLGESYQDYGMAYRDADGKVTGYAINGWDRERLVMDIDDDGLQQLAWNGRVETMETMNDNVALLGFDEVKDVARKELLALFEEGYLQDGNVKTIDMDIQKMELGLFRIEAPGNPTWGRIVPVWRVWGGHVEEYADEKVAIEKIAERRKKEFEDMQKGNTMFGMMDEEDYYEQTPEEEFEKYFSPESQRKAIASGEGIFPLLVINAIDGSVIGY